VKYRMIEELIKTNQSLKKEKLVIFTWGNASCRVDDHVYIKPSGVDFEFLNKENISKINLKTKALVSGLKQSVDTPTHLALYDNFNEVNAVIHTHSKYATIFAQAKKSIPCLGTTHADYFYGDIPLVYGLTDSEIVNEYELNTGKKIVEYFKDKNIDPLNMGAALCPLHGVFTWGKDLKTALKNAIVLEHIAETAFKTMMLNSDLTEKINQVLLDKHFLRKHGKNNYYGQK
tara:strand:+ start:1165 stop:1857 length:693 start_codon:yes stop_codon:yes gene_type:complete